MALYCNTTGQGEDLVLLHGWGMNSAVWQAMLPVLQKRYTVYCIDLPGHGASAGVVGEDVLETWLDALERVLPKQFYLCGWSLGGLLGLAVRKRWPQRVRGLMLLAAAPKFLHSQDWPALPAAQLQQFADGLQNDVAATLRQFIALQFLGTADSRLIQRQLHQALSAQGVATEQGLRQGLQLLRQLDLRDNFSDCAVLLGGRDKLVPPVLGQAMQLLSNSVVVEFWPHAAHAPHLLEPARVAKFIYTYIKESKPA